jgi:hypothetical protein
VFLFGGVRRFKGLGPLGLAFMGYRLWRRLSAQQKSAIRERAGSAASKLRGTSPSQDHTGEPAVPPLARERDDTAARRTVAAAAGAATAPSEEIAPTDLTSPGTITDPELEKQRAEQAVARERESRQTDVTKFEEQRLEQEAERTAGASALGDPPPAKD